MPAYVALHGRDHCPGGADPIPCWPGHFWRGTAGPVTLPASGNEETIAWTEWETSSTTIFSNTATPTAVELNMPGSYAVSAHYILGESFPDNTLWWLAVNDLWDAADVSYLTREGWAQLGDAINVSWTRTYPPIGETVGPTLPVAEIQVDAGQVDSIDHTIFAWLNIIYIGPMPDVVSSG